MSLGTRFNGSFFSGASRSQQVPGRFHCSIAGRGYMIDTERLAEFTRRGIPLLREQTDQSDSPGEQTLSSEELWRRSQDDWTSGAGQQYLDRSDSNPRRFRTSKGVDVWERWQMSLLPGTAVRRVSGNTILLAVAGTDLFVVDGGLFRTTDLSTFTAVTGLPSTPLSVTSDGFTVFTAHGASGVYASTRGSNAAVSHNLVAADLVGYVKGRLMVASGASLFNVTATGAAPTALYTHPNSDFRWVGFAEGQAAIYAAGFSGDKSLIYRTTIRPDGTALDVPVVAGELPDGEVVRSIYGYLGFVMLGTDAGVRMAAADGEGNLTIGSLIRTEAQVLCFEGQDRFVWFGWPNFDGLSTGLGRLDLSTFVGSLAPAYASDLMVTGQGSVTSVVTFRGVRVLGVSGVGVAEQTAALVSSGTLDTGMISYGLPDLKTAVYLDVKVADPVDSNRAYISVDGGAFTPIGIRSSSLSDPFSVGELSGEHFEIRHELIQSDATATVGPVITRYTLRSYPRPAQGEVFTVPLLLHELVRTLTGEDHRLSPSQEFNALVALRGSKQLVTFQNLGQTHTVTIDDALFAYHHETSDRADWNGTALVRMKSYAN